MTFSYGVVIHIHVKKKVFICEARSAACISATNHLLSAISISLNFSACSYTKTFFVLKIQALGQIQGIIAPHVPRTELWFMDMARYTRSKQYCAGVWIRPLSYLRF